ncbi:hypothetical protein FJTKL_12276 [Diaporthe vaccinii]|uniref:Uncharacterized protein n=1 Tax=Diaporthe vaccinii TaxID=105482 RepID=A0ABR4EEB8_9PEZI
MIRIETAGQTQRDIEVQADLCTCCVSLFGLAYVQGHAPSITTLWETKQLSPRSKPPQDAMPEQEDAPQQRAASSANVPQPSQTPSLWGVTMPCDAVASSHFRSHPGTKVRNKQKQKRDPEEIITCHRKTRWSSLN